MDSIVAELVYVEKLMKPFCSPSKTAWYPNALMKRRDSLCDDENAKDTGK